MLEDKIEPGLFNLPSGEKTTLYLVYYKDTLWWIAYRFYLICLRFHDNCPLDLIITLISYSTMCIASLNKQLNLQIKCTVYVQTMVKSQNTRMYYFVVNIIGKKITTNRTTSRIFHEVDNLRYKERNLR